MLEMSPMQGANDILGALLLQDITDRT